MVRKNLGQVYFEIRALMKGGHRRGSSWRGSNPLFEGGRVWRGGSGGEDSLSRRWGRIKFGVWGAGPGAGLMGGLDSRGRDGDLPAGEASTGNYGPSIPD